MATFDEFPAKVAPLLAPLGAGVIAARRGAAMKFLRPTHSFG
jgi:hypothetical protein